MQDILGSYGAYFTSISNPYAFVMGMNINGIDYLRIQIYNSAGVPSII